MALLELVSIQAEAELRGLNSEKAFPLEPSAGWIHLGRVQTCEMVLVTGTKLGSIGGRRSFAFSYREGANAGWSLRHGGHITPALVNGVSLLQGERCLQDGDEVAFLTTADVVAVTLRFRC